MKAIPNINGLTVELITAKRVVKYNGKVCPLINRREILCDQNTCYNGCVRVLDSWETYDTPIGVVERHYWARGLGLEDFGADWRIVPVEEIADAQKRYEKASQELYAARQVLEMVVQKIVVDQSFQTA